MLISRALLQTFFSKKLPSPEALALALTFHAFEIEESIAKGKDTVLDVKVLPDRTHDCLSHRGIAREVAAIMSLPLKPYRKPRLPLAKKPATQILVSVKDKRVRRYMALPMEGIRVGPSPKWLKEALEVLGQRSINNVVDATNYVMFMIGQPLHAFDAQKIRGGKIVIRESQEGETMITLDQKDVTLPKGVLVIADREGILGLAGIKGGTRAEVTSETTAILLEAANFDAGSIRRTAQTLHIRTDASRRFENGLTPYLAEEALAMVAEIIQECAGGNSVQSGKVTDYFPKKPAQKKIALRLLDIRRILGVDVSSADVMRVWKSLGFAYTVKKESSGDILFSVAIPHERLDLNIKENLVEEVGRLVGYDKLKPRLPKETVIAPVENKTWTVAEIVREIMLSYGFSEAYTYTFSDTGELKIANPLANDKKYLRNSLTDGLKFAVRENLKYMSAVRLFEVGHIFGRDEGDIKEELSFAVYVGFQKRKDAELRNDFFVLKGALDVIFRELRIEEITYREAGGELVAGVYVGNELLGTLSVSGFEMNFSRMVALSFQNSISFEQPSRFPSIVRDVSLFVPLVTHAGDVEALIRKNAGELLCSLSIFDVFEQPERKSFAFRMILQSDERTLSDEEANVVYDKVVQSLRAADPSWEVRA